MLVVIAGQRVKLPAGRHVVGIAFQAGRFSPQMAVSEPDFSVKLTAQRLIRNCIEWHQLVSLTVRRWFYLWRDNGLWLTLKHYLLMGLREHKAAMASPSAGVIDNQSVKPLKASVLAAMMRARRSRRASGTFFTNNRG